MIKGRVDFAVFSTLEAVIDILVEAFRTLENDRKRVHKTAGFDWIIAVPLNAT